MALEEFKKAVQARTPRTRTSRRASGQAYAGHRASSTTPSTAFRKALELNPYYVDVRNDLGTALILSGRREEGKNGVPDRVQRPHEPHARDLGAQPRPGLPRGEELRRGHQLVPHAASTATRPIPTPTSASPTRSSASGQLGRGGAPRWKRRPRSARRRGRCSSRWARPTRAPAVSRRRGLGWKRRAGKRPRGRGRPPRGRAPQAVPVEVAAGSRHARARLTSPLASCPISASSTSSSGPSAPTPPCSSTPRARW